MSTLKHNEFSEFEMSDSEILAGQLLSTFQLQVLHNLRATSARKKLAMLFTPHDVTGYQQLEAEVTSEINLINYLIECHELAVQHTLVQAHEHSYNPDSVLPSPGGIFDN